MREEGGGSSTKSLGFVFLCKNCETIMTPYSTGVIHVEFTHEFISDISIYKFSDFGISRKSD